MIFTSKTRALISGSIAMCIVLRTSPGQNVSLVSSMVQCHVTNDIISMLLTRAANAMIIYKLLYAHVRTIICPCTDYYMPMYGLLYAHIWIIIYRTTQTQEE